jgi:hypothetical protein
MGQTLVAVPLLRITTGCGGGDTPTGNTGGSGPKITASSDNLAGHQHTVDLFCTALSNGTLTYQSSNTGGHTHTVTLTTGELMMVVAGDPVSVQTLDGGHTHSWAIQQPPGLCP